MHAAVRWLMAEFQGNAFLAPTNRLRITTSARRATAIIFSMSAGSSRPAKLPRDASRLAQAWRDALQGWHGGCRAQHQAHCRRRAEASSLDHVADSTEGKSIGRRCKSCGAGRRTTISPFTARSPTRSAQIVDRFWNEHNFVWQKPDGLFYHGKGATPAFPNFAADTNGLTLIPMNMAEPILIARGLNAPNGLGFAPHGAGRNLSRTAFKKTLGEHGRSGIAPRRRPGPDWLDARWFSGTPDTSEMPGGYKNAESVRRQIARFGLAEIVDEVLPFGCIMAGEIDWRKAGKTYGRVSMTAKRCIHFRH
jgi:hypothetical protein